MTEKRGALIAIEGTDGSGKATQVSKLKDRFGQYKIPIFTIGFPRYDTPTGKVVRAYLQGEFGDPTKIDPKLAAVLYAADRAAASDLINECLASGTNVLCDRYIGSNLAHQGAKLPEQDREGFIRWNEEYEFCGLKIPIPDLTVCLHVPREETLRAMEKQERQKDGHEANLDYQQKVVETYLWLARKASDWKLIDCMDGNRRKTIEEVTEDAWKIIMPVLVR